jgi:hypothetical protein
MKRKPATVAFAIGLSLLTLSGCVAYSDTYAGRYHSSDGYRYYDRHDRYDRRYDRHSRHDRREHWRERDRHRDRDRDGPRYRDRDRNSASDREQFINRIERGRWAERTASERTANDPIFPRR